MHLFTLHSVLPAIATLTPGLALVTQCSGQQVPVIHELSHHDSGRNRGHTTGIQEGLFCTRNYECDSGCCDYGLVEPGYGWGRCGSGCWWLADNAGINRHHGGDGNANASNDACKHAIEFGVPTPYKLRVGNAAIVKADNNMQTDPFGDGSVFYAAAKGSGIALWVMKGDERDFVTKDLGFGTDRDNAATFNVSVSQYGRVLEPLKGEHETHGYVTKRVESGSGVGRLETSHRFEDAAVFTFTQYVKPRWENDEGPTRVKALLDLIERVCKPDDGKCAELLFENLRPESLGQFSSCQIA